MIFLPGSVAGSIQTLGLQGDFEVFQTSIYGVSSTVSNWLALSGFGAVPNSANWQIYKSNTGSFLPTTQTDFRYGYLSGGNPSLDASLEPLSARLLVSVLGGSYFSKNIVPLKPYDSPLDIPNLQLWLDASDDNTIISEKLNSEFWFTNNTSYLQISETIVLSGDFTVEGWIRKQQRSSDGYSILFMGDGTTAGNTQFWIDFSGEGTAGIHLASSLVAYTTTTPISTNVLQHIAYVREGSNIRIYVDGISRILSTGPGNPTTQVKILRINQWRSGGYGFIGGQTNFRIVNGKALYTTNFNPTISAATPLQPISESGVTTPLLILQDSTATQNNGNVPGITLTSSGTFTSIPSKTLLVPSWLDKSPNALTVSQTVINNQTTLLSAEINGLNVVNFDGVNEHFNLSSPIFLSGNYSHFFVYRRPSSVPSIPTNVSLGNKISDAQSTYLHYTDNFIYSSNTGTNSSVASATTLIGGLRKNEYIQVDLEPKLFTTPWGGLPKTVSVNTLGVYRNSFYQKGPMCEVIHTGSMLPNQEIDLVNRKLYDKWKVPKQVPFLRTAPILSTGTSTSAISSTMGTWYIEPTSYSVEWLRSLNNDDFTTIINTLSTYTNPLAVSVYNPTTADYGAFLKVSISATNSFGIGVF